MKLHDNEIKLIIYSLYKEYSYLMNEAEKSKDSSFHKYYSERAEVYKKLMNKVAVGDIYRMNNPLIKIKVSDKDREILSDMLSCAVSYMVELQLTAYSQDDADYYLKREARFKDLRQRITFEELEDES